MSGNSKNMIGYYAKSHWFQSGALFVLLSVLALWLLVALNDLKEMAERQEVDLTIRNIRVGMQLAAAEALTLQRSGEVDGWVGRNPVRWLAGEPRNYLGECSTKQAQNLREGGWCFENVHKELVYRPLNSGRLRQSAGGVAGCEDLRWRVTRAGEVKTVGFVGVRLVTVNSCRWGLETN